MVEGSRRFGSHIKNLREAHRLTLEDVERLTLRDPEPVTRSFLSRLEHGMARVSAAKLISLSRIFNVRSGLLAERLERDMELERVQFENTGDWSIDQLFGRAREAAQNGAVARALLLFEQAEARNHDSGDRSNLRHRAQLEAARALLLAGRPRSARAAVDPLLGERLEPDHLASALCLLSQASLALHQPVLARAAYLALIEIPTPWPVEVEIAAPVIAGEYFLFQNRLDDAFSSWLAALETARREKDQELESLASVRLAEIERRRGRLAPAMDWIHRVQALSEKETGPKVSVLAALEEGRVYRQRNRPDLARTAWSRARRQARQAGLQAELFEVYLELWRLDSREGNRHLALASLRTLRHLSRLLEAIPPTAEDLLPHLPAQNSAGTDPIHPTQRFPANYSVPAPNIVPKVAEGRRAEPKGEYSDAVPAG